MWRRHYQHQLAHIQADLQCGNIPAGAALKPLAAGTAAAAAAMPGIAPTPGMTPPGGNTSKPVLRSLFLLGGGDSDLDLSLSFLLLCLSLLRDLLRLSLL